MAPTTARFVEDRAHPGWLRRASSAVVEHDQAVACHAPVGTPCIPRSASMLAKHESSDPLGSATGDLVSGQGRDGEAHEAGSFHDPEPDRSTGRPKGVDARTPACG